MLPVQEFVLSVETLWRFDLEVYVGEVGRSKRSKKCSDRYKERLDPEGKRHLEKSQGHNCLPFLEEMELLV